MAQDLPGNLLPAQIAHEGDGLAHVHEMSLDERGRLTEHIWKVENVELTTVGIDIGSSTSHLMFSGVRLQRKTQALSSRFVVVERKALWKSPILLTPFVADGTIDARALGAFVRDCYREAGLASDAVDTGAVILTGEAIKRSNARAIADLFATEGGRFVCASAGHHLECVLAAHGSGAVGMSRATGRVLLNIDVGGGTTKLALVAGGEVLSTCAFAVGGRLVAFDGEGRISRVDDSASHAAHACGVSLARGDHPDAHALSRIVDALAEAAVAAIRGDPPGALGEKLMLTEPLQRAREPDAVVFSGGVAEYFYDRETRDFGDIARALAQRLRAACESRRIPWKVETPHEGIRATVIGASQFTVQVSGKTIHVGTAVALPLRNVPVIVPAIEPGDRIDAGEVARAVQAALGHAEIAEDAPVALALPWSGDPHHARLRGLAEGIALALAPRSSGAAPLVLLIDADVARTLGHILEHELHFARALVCIDGVQLKEFDFVDIGAVISPADVVPVVIKSLLFADSAAASAAVSHFKPVQPRSDRQ